MEVTLKLRRFNPETDTDPHWESYQVPAEPTDRLLDLAEVLVACAQARQESRGGHFREDFPTRDDVNFMRHTMAYKQGDEIRLDYKPVTVTRYQPMERKY